MIIWAILSLFLITNMTMQRNLGGVEQKNSAITLRWGVKDQLFQYSRSISITPLWHHLTLNMMTKGQIAE